MDRRSFLKWQMSGMLLAAASPGLMLPKPALADGTPDICVAKGAPGAAVRAAVDMLGGMSRFVKSGQKVVIKPNMSFARGPETATNTHPEVVRELVILCKEAGASRVRVLDNPLQNAASIVRLSGIFEACDSVESNICHHLSQASQYREADISGGKEMRANGFMRDVLDADVIIAAPVAKCHSGAGVSLCLKGQMGLISDRHVMHSRYDLHGSIVDLNTRIKPHLAVIDATRVLTTNGPGGPGKVITPGEIIASADPVAADATAVSAYEWYGVKVRPRQVGHILQAHERGLGRMDIENLVTKRVTV